MGRRRGKGRLEYPGLSITRGWPFKIVHSIHYTYNIYITVHTVQDKSRIRNSRKKEQNKKDV